MKPSLLIVTMGTDAVAPARMPCELRRAGFAVTLLAPRDSLAANTGLVDRIGHFPPGVTFHQWVRTVAGAVRAVAPALILPGDEVALRTLMRLVLERPPGLRGGIVDDLGALVRRSFGDPAGWVDSIDKSRLFDVARRAGVPIAEGDVATGEAEAVGIASRLGYPVIVRPSAGSGGSGVARCESAADLRAAVRAAARPAAALAGETVRHVVQRWIDGRVVNRASVAWNGDEVAGVTRGRLQTHSGPFGPASVVEFLGLPEVRESTRRLYATLGVHGFAGAQFVVERDRGTPLLIEVHRRMIPATHSGALVGIDLAAALFAAQAGRPWDGPADLPDGPGLRLALFPQEWYRDPDSAWLRSLPTDTPWHDPRLLEAMLRLPIADDTAATPPAPGIAAA